MSFINKLEEFIGDKITEMGSEAIMHIVEESPLGAAMAAAESFSEFIETGGRNELEALAKPVIDFKFHGPELLEKIQQAFDKPVKPTRIAAWQRHAWATSRQDWLDNAWKHDWRSQPRNRIGEWIPGRLPYPVANAPAVGRGSARSSRARRRHNRYRRYGRIAARSYKPGG